MIQAVIFDADGMVLQNKTDIFSNRLHQEYQVPLEKILPFFKNEFQKCLVGEADLKEELEKYIPEWNWKKSIDELLQFWFEHESVVDQNIIDSIEELQSKGISCYLATNNEKYRTQFLSENLHLKNSFQKIFSSSTLGYKKPQPEFWGCIFEQLSPLEKKDILVWDDDEKNVLSARTFGFQAEQYTDFEHYQKTLEKF